MVSLKALAGGVPDLTKTGSITVRMRDGGQPVQGGTFTLYKAGDVSEGTEGFYFVLAEGFEGSGMSLVELQTPELAKKLAAYAAEEEITAITEQAGRDGTVIFNDLFPGLYLLVQSQAAPGYYAAEPFLVTLPLRDGGKYCYQVDASPKTEPLRPVGSETEPESETAPENPELPYTGQTVFPVHLLGTAGVFLVLSGFVLRRIDRKDQR